MSRSQILQQAGTAMVAQANSLPQSVLKLPLGVIYRGIVPFLFIYLFALGLITYIPEISLFGMRILLNH